MIFRAGCCSGKLLLVGLLEVACGRRLFFVGEGGLRRRIRLGPCLGRIGLRRSGGGKIQWSRGVLIEGRAVGEVSLCLDSSIFSVVEC
jgi:hypothetical protein